MPVPAEGDFAVGFEEDGQNMAKTGVSRRTNFPLMHITLRRIEDSAHVIIGTIANISSKVNLLSTLNLLDFALYRRKFSPPTHKTVHKYTNFKHEAPISRKNTQISGQNARNMRVNSCIRARDVILYS